MLRRNRISGADLFLIFLVGFLTFSCQPTRIVREFHDPVRLNTSPVKNKTIKVHMTDGCLYLLDSLIATGSSDTVEGFGSYYDQYRDLIRTNVTPSGSRLFPVFIIPLDKVALFETNKVEGVNGKILAMTLVGVPSAIVNIYCIINPKACFGSCPTFYAWDGKDTLLMAEGFSSSILRSFEKQDIDMLYHARTTGNNIDLRLTNEALETHIIRYADLLAFPRKEDERVFATESGTFAQVSDIQRPSSCIADEGSCLEEVMYMDRKERYCETDSKNLAAREFIEVCFDSVPGGDPGLIIGSRQTFLTTFLFYQSLAYLGHSAGNFAAKVESGNLSLQKKVNKVWDILGGIDVSVQDREGNWIKVSTIEEMGPIASDVHLVKLPETGSTDLKIRLGLTRGLWRIDYLALGKMGQSAVPARIKPSRVITEKQNFNKNLATQLNDTLNPLITLPGDSYILSYDLPGTADTYELFLCSKGYYIEWMREPWLEEENLRKAAMFFGFPRLFMRTAAADFKLVEPTMEENFWKSRYVKKN